MCVPNKMKYGIPNIWNKISNPIGWYIPPSIPGHQSLETPERFQGYWEIKISKDKIIWDPGSIGKRKQDTDCFTSEMLFLFETDNKLYYLPIIISMYYVVFFKTILIDV